MFTWVPRSPVWHGLAVTAMVVLVHRPPLGSFFVEDDARNLYIGSWVQNWWAVLYDREGALEVNTCFSRPLKYFSLWLDW